MKVALALSIIGFLVFGVISVRRAMRKERVAGQLEATVFFFGMILVLSTYIFTVQYRDERREVEGGVLMKVAQAQNRVLEKQGQFGYKADVIKADRTLFGERFQIENGIDGKTSYLSTERCEIVIIKKAVLGPRCGSGKS